MKKHKHHIIPKHAGGSNDIENLVELTPEEHAEAHRVLYEKYGRIQDKVAWMGLAKLAPISDLIRELQRETKLGSLNPMYGKPAPNRGVARPGIGGRKKGSTWSAEERKKQEETRKTPGYYDYTKNPERAKKISQALKGRKGAASGKTWFTNGLMETYDYECPMGFVKGRKPGRNNNKKGMVWYNNGEINKQYYEGQQLEGFIRGRISKKQ